jgi:hypothetical protein
MIVIDLVIVRDRVTVHTESSSKYVRVVTLIRVRAIVIRPRIVFTPMAIFDPVSSFVATYGRHCSWCSITSQAGPRVSITHAARRAIST